jgi:hypothetical protein
MWQLRDATLELLAEVFSIRSVSRYYKQDKCNWETVAASKGVNTEVEEDTALEAVTRQWLVKRADLDLVVL